MGDLYTSLRNLALSIARRTAHRQATIVRFADVGRLDYESLRSSPQAILERHAAEMHTKFQHRPSRLTPRPEA